MVVDQVTVVSVVAASCLAVATIAGFALFRHRGSSLVLTTSGANGSNGHDLGALAPGAFDGSDDDAHDPDPDGPHDPLIARRVATLAQRTDLRPAESARRVDGGPTDARFGPGTALVGLGATPPPHEPDMTPDTMADPTPDTMADPTPDTMADPTPATMADMTPALGPDTAPDMTVDTAPALGSLTLAPPTHEGPVPGAPPSTPDEILRQLLVDPVTGLGSRLAWDRWVAEEEVRERRYRRPATIVLAQVDGVEEVAAFFGEDAATRVVTAIAEIVRANVRASDHAAVVGPASLAALLPETDEVRAVNFVERVRVPCDAWLASNAPTVRIGFGWASPGPANDLVGARALAERRLARDLNDAPAGAIRG